MTKLTTLALVFGLALAGCGDDKKSPQKSPCETLCDAAAKANCPNADPDSVCLSICQEIYDAATCQAENRALIKCMPTATWTCDLDGYPGYIGCDVEFDAYTNCND